METVKAVVWLESLCATIGSSRRRRASSVVIGAQTMPEVWRMMNAIFSAVQSEAATIRSPSPSRSLSSVTTTSSPLAKACRTSWIVSANDDLLSGNRHVTQGDHVRAKRRFSSGIARAFSFIRTFTVGSGIAPDLLDPSQEKMLRKALAGSQHEAAYRR